jgi:hypothetical protein
MKILFSIFTSLLLAFAPVSGGCAELFEQQEARCPVCECETAKCCVKQDSANGHDPLAVPPASSSSFDASKIVRVLPSVLEAGFTTSESRCLTRVQPDSFFSSSPSYKRFCVFLI